MVGMTDGWDEGATQVMVMMLCDFAYVTLVSDDDGNVI